MKYFKNGIRVLQNKNYMKQPKKNYGARQSTSIPVNLVYVLYRTDLPKYKQVELKNDIYEISEAPNYVII